MAGGKNRKSDNHGNSGQSSVITCLLVGFSFVVIILFDRASCAGSRGEMIGWGIIIIGVILAAALATFWFWPKPEDNVSLNEKTDYRAMTTAFNALLGCALLTVALVGVAFHFLGEQIFVAVDSKGYEQLFGFITVPGIVLLVGAAITLGWTAWRCKIQSIQTDEQIEQGKRFAEQMRIVDHNNVARLLVDAAQMLDDESPAKRNAALAILKQIGLGKDEEFAIAAAEVIETVLEGQTIKYPNDCFIHRCYEVATEIHSKHNTTASARLHFSYCGFSGSFPVFAGGVYEYCGFFRMDVNFDERISINKCRFELCNIDCIFGPCGEITFSNCRISKLGCLFYAHEKDFSLKFVGCDFSGFEYSIYKEKFSSSFDRKVCVFEDCYYYADNPPVEAFLEAVGPDIKKRDPAQRDKTVATGAQ